MYAELLESGELTEQDVKAIHRYGEETHHKFCRFAAIWWEAGWDAVALLRSHPGEVEQARALFAS
jgi:hypothetical protein